MTRRFPAPDPKDEDPEAPRLSRRPADKRFRRPSDKSSPSTGRPRMETPPDGNDR